MHFGLGGFDQYIKGIETGIMIDLMFRDIDIMVLEPSRPLLYQSLSKFAIRKKVLGFYDRIASRR